MAKIGFDIGGTNIAAGLVSDEGVLVKKGSLPFPQDKDFEKVMATCEQLVAALEEGETEPVRSIGVAVPGSIDATASIVLNAFNLGFSNTPLKAALEEIDSLEKTTLDRTAYQRWNEYFPWFLVPGAALLLFAVSLQMFASRRLV